MENLITMKSPTRMLSPLRLSVRNIDLYNLCSSACTVTSWLASYVELIFPICNSSEWMTPPRFEDKVVRPPRVVGTEVVVQLYESHQTVKYRNRLISVVGIIMLGIIGRHVELNLQRALS